MLFLLVVGLQRWRKQRMEPGKELFTSTQAMLPCQEHQGGDAGMTVGDFVSSQAIDRRLMALKIKALDRK